MISPCNHDGWLTHYTQRFALSVGRRCRTATIQDGARQLHLDWRTVKELDKHYMREQLRREGTPTPRMLGIDEIAIRKGHAPPVSILFDKFHFLRYLNEASEQVRRQKYARLRCKDRQFIKGQEYTLLSPRDNLSLDGCCALKKLLHANKRLQTAYLSNYRFRK